MKNFYFACSKTENGRRYAWMMKIPANNNIISRIAPDAPDILHPCPTKKDAVRIVNHWNACYIANGKHLFETTAHAGKRKFRDTESGETITESELKSIFTTLKKEQPEEYNYTFEEYVKNSTSKNGFLEEVNDDFCGKEG